MGWVSVTIEAPRSGAVKGEAVFHDPSQDWLNALLYAVKFRLRFPCPTANMGPEIPMVVDNVYVKTEPAEMIQTYGSPFKMGTDHRVVTIQYLYDTGP